MSPQWNDARLDELSRRVDSLESKINHMIGDPIAEGRRKRGALIIGVSSAIAGVFGALIVHLVFG